MKNKKRMYQGFNRKQLKEVATELKTEVDSLTTQIQKDRKNIKTLYIQLEQEKIKTNEYKDLCVAYTSENLDLKMAHDQDVLNYKRKIKALKEEIETIKYSNSKIAEQLDYFTNELLYVNEENKELSIENARLKQRGLIERIFNRGK